jgi:hypothetical protein
VGRDCCWWLFLVGCHVLSHRLTGSHYRDFLLHDLPKLLEDVPLAVRARMWYVLTVLRAVRDVLSNTYHDQWIGTGGPTAWPPRSTGLNPLVLHVGTPKCGSCWQQRDTSPSHCGCLSDCPQLPRHLCVDTAVRLETCRGVHWIWWRTYYKSTLSAVTHKLNASGNILVWTVCLILVCGTRAQSSSAPFSYTLCIHLYMHIKTQWIDN